MATRVVRLPEVIALTGYRRSTLYDLIRRQKFPQRIRLGPRAVGWLEDEVLQWINTRARAEDDGIVVGAGKCGR